MFSIVILTLNEEAALPGCLASTHGCDDVVVLDSGSTDRTTEIARAAGARVVVNRFEDFAQQRNFAHGQIEFRHPWVFHLDADEKMTPGLIEECAAAAQAAEDIDGFFAAPQMFFRGRWIPHCTDYPAWQARFCRADKFRFIQAGHGQREAPGSKLEYLYHPYTHDLSAHDEAELAEKYARYALHEAAAFIKSRRTRTELWQAWKTGNPLVRRRVLKEISYYLPARGALRFIYQYGLKCGFLDGKPGLGYCLLLARYERRIAAEIRKLRRSAS